MCVWTQPLLFIIHVSSLICSVNPAYCSLFNNPHLALPWFSMVSEPGQKFLQNITQQQQPLSPLEHAGIFDGWSVLLPSPKPLSRKVLTSWQGRISHQWALIVFGKENACCLVTFHLSLTYSKSYCYRIRFTLSSGDYCNLLNWEVHTSVGQKLCASPPQIYMLWRRARQGSLFLQAMEKSMQPSNPSWPGMLPPHNMLRPQPHTMFRYPLTETMGTIQWIKQHSTRDNLAKTTT